MRSFKHYLIIVAISLLPLIGIFVTPDLLHTHDGLVHLARMASYYKELTAWQIPVRWASDLNYGYGLPLFNFIYPLPYLISAGFIGLGLNLITTFKVVLALSFVLSGVAMFAFAREFFKDLKKAWVVTLFYQFIPFRLIELLVRGSYGEVYVYALFPAVLWGLVRIFHKSTKLNITVTSFLTALLIISHNSMSLVFFGLAVLFLLRFKSQRKALIFGGLSLTLGLLLSAFYWLPALAEHKYTYGDLFMRDLYKSHFTPLLNFFLPNFTNSRTLQTGGIAVQIGFFHVIAFLLTIYLLLRRRLSSVFKKISLYSLLAFGTALVFMLPISKPIWERVSLLRQFQFPWRFLSVIGFATALMSVNYLTLPFFQKNKNIFILLALTVISTIYYWRPPLGFDRVKDESVYWNYPLNTTYFGETDVIWSAGPAKAYPKARIEVIEGKATITNFTQKSILQNFRVSADTPSKLVSHTEYFPGWRVYVDNVKTPIEFQNQDWRGLITFPVNSGKHEVSIRFGETPLRLMADIVSLTTLLSLMAIGIVYER